MRGGTRVMTLGRIQPQLRQQYMWPTPSFDQPQNLLRATLQNGPHAFAGGVHQAANLASLGRIGKMLGQTPMDYVEAWSNTAPSKSGSPSTNELAPPAGTPQVPDGMNGYQLGGWALLSTASMGASAYHGYRRNQSVPWALWWGLMGAMFPIVTPAIGLAQGWGTRKRG